MLVRGKVQERRRETQRERGGDGKREKGLQTLKEMATVTNKRVRTEKGKDLPDSLSIRFGREKQQGGIPKRRKWNQKPKKVEKGT